MSDSKRKMSYAAFSAVIALSSITMVWLFWRFPIHTGVGSIALLACLFYCVRIARSLDLVVGAD